MKKPKSLSPAQRWARERFLTKGHLTLARDNMEEMVLQASTLPQEMKLLSLSINHLNTLLKDFDKGTKESKKQYMLLNK